MMTMAAIAATGPTNMVEAKFRSLETKRMEMEDMVSGLRRSLEFSQKEMTTSKRRTKDSDRDLVTLKLKKRGLCIK